jgi:Pyruvate phosphate dikinase, AMP/ATP-binding domain
VSEHLELVSRYGMRAAQFSDLMAYRVREVLLVASLYDAFVLEEDGQLAELVSEEYRSLELNLRYAPRFTRAGTGREALALLADKPFDMVVATARLADMTVQAFGAAVKATRPGLPFGVLASHGWEVAALQELRETGAVDWLFLWQGDVRTLLAMFRQVEDRRNADHDVLEAGVQAIILVEDDVRFLSFYLPHVYTEVTQQTRSLMAEGLNLSHRLLRIRARPKILLVRNFEEAWALYERYAENILGVISDVRFPRGGKDDPEAGLTLARMVRERDEDVPILLQSSEAIDRGRVEALRASFQHKDSPELLAEIGRYIVANFGFGDFVFYTPDRTEIGRARNLRELLFCLTQVPDAAIEYHASHNHFSRWLKARTEFELASALRPRTVAEFASIGDLRAFLIGAVTDYLRELQRYVITDFDVEHFDEFVAFARIGSGSLGGKGRGLAFVQKLLAQERFDIEGAEIAIPQTVVVAADVFESFLDDNDLRPVVAESANLSDGEILDAFRRGRFPRERRAELARFLETVSEPIAVRSSSILEDSLYQPFAGVYATVMLPNNHPSLDIRLAQLLESIKVVYASTYMRPAREYLETTPHRIEEERMAVLLQRLVGSSRGARFYPTLSGLASSYNFYPFRNMRPEDGVGLVALGLGKSVVEGFETLRFCPAYPQVLPQFSSVKDMLRNAQRRFWALDLSRADVVPGLEFDANLVSLDVTQAVNEGAADMITSSYIPANDTVRNGLVRGGIPLISFAPLLKGQQFPLPAILVQLLKVTQEGIGIPVEIEFAADLGKRLDGRQTFQVLQLRPMMVEQLAGEAFEETGAEGEALVVSASALGHGRSQRIADLLVVAADLDRARTSDVAMALERLNGELRREGRPCVLIGPGRWGSRDPWLGVPVSWSQISSARAIVETDFADLEVEPSQGSHFFHNLTSFGVAYLAVHRRQDGGRIAWDWLATQPAAREELGGCVRHLRLDGGVRVLVDGANNRGMVVLEPEQR